MSRLTRIGIALSYVSLVAVPLYGASGDTKQVQDLPAVSTPALPMPRERRAFARVCRSSKRRFNLTEIKSLAW